MSRQYKASPEVEALIIKYHLKNPYLKANPLAQLIVEKESLPISANYLRNCIPTILANKPQEMDLTMDTEDLMDLPESDYKPCLPFQIPKSVNNILIIGDIHIPYHDLNALRLTLKYAKDRGINGIVLNGDIADFYQDSDFVRDRNMRDIPGELVMVKHFFRSLRQIFSNIEIYYKIGNHEERHERYLMMKAPEYQNLPSLSYAEIFEVEKFGIELIKDRRTIRAGKANIIHGHEIRLFSGGVNVARSVRLKTLENTITNHFHKKQDDTAPTISGKIQAGASIGCLCGLNPFYMPINAWCHGFGILQTEASGDFELDNKMLINGKIK